MPSAYFVGQQVPSVKLIKNLNKFKITSITVNKFISNRVYDKYFIHDHMDFTTFARKKYNPYKEMIK